MHTELEDYSFQHHRQTVEMPPQVTSTRWQCTGHCQSVTTKSYKCILLHSWSLSVFNCIISINDCLIHGRHKCNLCDTGRSDRSRGSFRSTQWTAIWDHTWGAICDLYSSHTHTEWKPVRQCVYPVCRRLMGLLWVSGEWVWRVRLTPGGLKMENVNL